ncbi:MAG: MBL fold metallo-hydrolase [Candidatus Riflebacteria bacterium]|nr:MBL fold metallo-hydrolase [Candidatus Riflebacteria bacterium]
MQLKTLEVGPFGTNCIVVHDEGTLDAVVVDPGNDPEVILSWVESAHLKVRALLHTHGHLDHIGATRAVAKATGAKILLHQADRTLYDTLVDQARMFGLRLEPPAPIDRFLEDEQTLDFGPLSCTVLHTPGHSPGAVCFHFREQALVLSGDTLFAGSVGRTDLWGGSHDQLIKSIRQRLMVLDDATRVVTGHGPQTTIGEERAINPFLRGR